jgi:hypothetical protein
MACSKTQQGISTIVECKRASQNHPGTRAALRPRHDKTSDIHDARNGHCLDGVWLTNYSAILGYGVCAANIARFLLAGLTQDAP